MDDLEKILPSTITSAARRSGNELVIPFIQANRAISIASEGQIAVLGIEVFRILESGLGVVTYSGYEFEFEGDWPKYVRLNNDAALSFMNENRMDDCYRYILTSTSEEEFERLSAGA
jgi:hypothetical protein